VIFSFEKRFVVSRYLSVPQTDTGGLREYLKAIGRKWFKELGNINWA
jgi:hypothetical protein